MKNLKQKQHSNWGSQSLFPTLLFGCVLIIMIVAGSYMEKLSNMQGVDMLRQATRKAVIQCYAIEGSYPPDITYLEENYGLEYNHDKYFVDYERYASNLMPYVDVFERE